MNSGISPKELLQRSFRLQFITNGIGVNDTIAGAEAALRGGCKWIQLRMKDASREEIIEAGKKLRNLTDRFGATFILDDHVELVETVGADGVHLGKNDMPHDNARRLLGSGKIIGATANRFEEIRMVSKRGADYIGLGPFRFTTTKKNLSPVLGVEGYANIMAGCRREGIYLPVVAIGGITIADIPHILATGVHGIAVSGAILNATEPDFATSEWLRTITDSLKKILI